MQPDGIRFVRPLLGCGRNRPALTAPRTFAFRAFRPETRYTTACQTVRLSPHDTLTERNAEAESKKYFVLLLSF